MSLITAGIISTVISLHVAAMAAIVSRWLEEFRSRWIWFTSMNLNSCSGAKHREATR